MKSGNIGIRKHRNQKTLESGNIGISKYWNQEILHPEILEFGSRINLEYIQSNSLIKAIKTVIEISLLISLIAHQNVLLPGQMFLMLEMMIAMAKNSTTKIVMMVAMIVMTVTNMMMTIIMMMID